VLIVGLTGNIASGKSTVAAAFVSCGATLIDSDVAAREAVALGTPALSAIAARFGAQVLTPDGALDRAALGRLVFADAEARRALERIVHPAVEAVRVSAIASARANGAAIVICDIPLLFEARLAWQFPRIVLVDAPATLRIERLVRFRGMRSGDAESRVRAQMPASLKRPRSDVILDNVSDPDALERQAEQLWQRIGEWAAVAAPVRAV
jgi:dephospho-CoA kinase